MISNYHQSSEASQASAASEGSEAPGPAYYTLAGFDNDVAVKSQNKKTAAATNKKQKQTTQRRGLFNRKRTNSQDTNLTDASKESLSYSTTSSVQSAGESTGSEFSDILRVLELQEDNEKSSSTYKLSNQNDKDLSKVENKLQRGTSTYSNHSTESSLNYSTDGDSHLDSFLKNSNNSLSRGGAPSSNRSVASSQYDYSTDGESTQLEGAKLLKQQAAVRKESSKQGLLGDFGDDKSEEEPFDMLFEPASSPKYRSKKQKKEEAAAQAKAKQQQPKVKQQQPKKEEAPMKPEEPKVPSRESSTTTDTTSTSDKSKKETTTSGVSTPLRDRSSSTRASATGGRPTTRPSSVTSTSNNKNNSRGSTTKSQTKDGEGDEFTKAWNCGAGILEQCKDNLPASVPNSLRKVKTFIRPFLCGVI